ncbi:hypothetical protein [Wolbachia endosymbiont (group A) of Lasioglossum morio]|uniref:hypothetical protein n=1 Tax=Wolbachia endosymbiont (group A) of Lasioglossum morio TaxID=2954025 RepID=UPI00222687F7|nr:hypothetical protein [Wolbachia endosymbiont (group A) of Lasioglossum morio]
MFTSGIQPKNKLLIAGAGLLFFAMVLPSFFLLAKIAIGLAMIAIATIAIKISSKTISNALEKEKAEVAQQTTQSKIINLAIGLTSIFVGGLSLFIIAQTGLIAACAAITALALHEYVKNQEIGKEINDKFDKVADDTINFIVSSVEKLIPTKPPGITA